METLHLRYPHKFSDWLICRLHGSWTRVRCSHDPCSRAVLRKSIARHCFFSTRPVFTGALVTQVVFTARGHGPWTRLVWTGLKCCRHKQKIPLCTLGNLQRRKFYPQHYSLQKLGSKTEARDKSKRLKARRTGVNLWNGKNLKKKIQAKMSPRVVPTWYATVRLGVRTGSLQRV